MRLYTNLGIRLSGYLAVLLIAGAILAEILPNSTTTTVRIVLLGLALVCYGAYILPLLTAQKQRVDTLRNSISMEAIELYQAIIDSRSLGSPAREELNGSIKQYLTSLSGDFTSHEADRDYFQLLRFCSKHRKTAGMQPTLDRLVFNERNRAIIKATSRQSIYTHEWFSLLLLWLVVTATLLTMSFSNTYESVGAIIIFTAYTLPLISLKKLENLDHKKAQNLWEPYTQVLETDFDKFD